MNATNRALNRAVVLVAGLLLLTVGGAAVALGAIERVGDGWADAAPTGYDGLERAFGATPLGVNGASWLLLVVIALCLLAVVLLLAFIFRQGRGRTSTLVDRRGTDAAGDVIVASAVAEQSLQAALDTRLELVSASVATYAVRRRPVLEITATVRRGVSPRDVSDVVDGCLRAFDQVLGEEIPALVHLSRGIRTRPTRVR